MPPVHELLPRLLGRLARESGDAYALGPLWAAAVGDALARHTRPRALENGTLLVLVDGPQWARALEAEEARVRERREASQGPGSVRALSLRVTE